MLIILRIGGAKWLAGLRWDAQHLHISIVLPLRNQVQLITGLLKRLYDPSSPDYNRFLNVAQFAEQFGPSAEDYAAVVNFARVNGFSVTDAPRII